jgi:integrase
MRRCPIMDNTAIEGKLPVLFSALEKQLESLDYSCNTLRHYKWTIVELVEFMSSNSLFIYSIDIGCCFIRAQIPIRTAYRVKQMQTVIFRLNDILLGNGYVSMHRETRLLYPDRFSAPYRAYFDMREEAGLAPRTLNVERDFLGRFLFALEDAGVDSLTALDPHCVQKAFISCHADQSAAFAIHRFLRFIHEDGLVATDYSPLIPRVRRPRTVPSVYSDDEVARLLRSIDRTSPVGRRDYAMVLIAVELGLRAGDIVSLKPENIDCDRNIISLVQSKTGSPLELPLLEVVREAIAEYITAARPKSKRQEVFLCSRAPYRPMSQASFTSAVAKYFRRAEIETTGKHHGPHSLRASMATRLLAEDVPYGVIQKVLGHRSALSAKAYLNIDIERLRGCALEVPAPMGLFAKRVTPVEGR